MERQREKERNRKREREKRVKALVDLVFASVAA
jgi:hypothetical protein